MYSFDLPRLVQNLFDVYGSPVESYPRRDITRQYVIEWQANNLSAYVEIDNDFRVIRFSLEHMKQRLWNGALGKPQGIWEEKRLRDFVKFLVQQSLITYAHLYLEHSLLEGDDGYDETFLEIIGLLNNQCPRRVRTY